MLAYRKSEQIADTKGIPYPDCLIIERPELKTISRMIFEGILTVLLWGYWWYLWLPLIALLINWIGCEQLQDIIPQRIKLWDFAQEQLFFLYVIGLAIDGIAVWTVYNFKRYGSLNRSGELLVTDQRLLAKELNVPSKKIIGIQRAKFITFLFNEDDSIKDIKIILAFSCRDLST